VLVFGGGIVPPEDVTALKAQGVAEIFTPGTRTGEIVDWLRTALAAAPAGTAGE
jgi:methylmalonyl-CoA mutase C-terminal domain/subunit